MDSLPPVVGAAGRFDVGLARSLGVLYGLGELVPLGVWLSMKPASLCLFLTTT